MTPKFRAWIKDYQVMRSVEFLAFNEKGVAEIFTNPEDGEPEDFRHTHSPEQAILMQSTGLKDCNDREIYEGDVIKVSDGLYEIDEENPFVVVKWDEEAGGYTMKDFTGEFDALNIGWQIADKFVRVEVVGNIYENPELLEEVEKCTRLEMQDIALKKHYVQ